MICPRFHCFFISITAASFFPGLRNVGTYSEKLIPSTTANLSLDKTFKNDETMNNDVKYLKSRETNPMKFSDCFGLSTESRHQNSKSLFCNFFNKFQGVDKKISKKSTNFVKKAIGASSVNVIDHEKANRINAVYDDARINKRDHLEKGDSLFQDTRKFETEPKEERFRRLARGRQQQCRPNFPVTYADNEPLPWTCRQRKQWLALPDIYYPNRLHETICEGSSCMNGHFNCTPVTYTTHLLRVCYDSHCNDDRVPYSLRNTWVFVDYELTVGCTCSR